MLRVSGDVLLPIHMGRVIVFANKHLSYHFNLLKKIVVFTKYLAKWGKFQEIINKILNLLFKIS